MSAPSVNDGHPLLGVLNDPNALTKLSAKDWELLTRMSRREGLLARLAIKLDEIGAFKQTPSRVQDHLIAAMVIAADHERMIRWELNRIELALSDLKIPVLLLKGAAYLAADLPPAKGRLVSDVDIMVPKNNLDAVEATLIEAGWETEKLHPYDQIYYRKWMHELPPLRHVARQTDVDVHHTILPLTSRLKPAPEVLFDSAVRIHDSRFKVLSPADMVLHSATHLFHDGEFDHGLRDLVDLHDLLEHFGTRGDFWERIVPRSVELHLQRPLFYALRNCRKLLGTRVPDDVMRKVKVGAPSQPWLKLMDVLIERALVPERPVSPRFSTAYVRWLLYIRSHYLRMPLYLLIPHLIRKAFRLRRTLE